MRRVRLERIRQQPSLPDTAIELQRIALLFASDDKGLLLREAATEHRLKQTALDQYGILSFATHGVLAGQLGRGIEPGLILTPPAEATDEDDGFLGLGEVATLDLNADWVVLSACNTAAGADAETGDVAVASDRMSSEVEGLTGLAKAFTYAGAKALLVSHWSVGSAATVELMEHLFRGYRERDLPRAEAHRQAMLALIDAGDPLLSHPSLWAPFVVLGDGG
jgi:CHAT domain-containing protein